VKGADRANELQTVLAGNNVPTLDGYRAVGIFLVAADHFGYTAPGGMALTGFFALSGFLITWLLRKEQLATGDISVRRFYLRRALRILPAYYVYVLLSLALMMYLGKPVPYGPVTSSLAYVANYYNALNGHPPGPFSHLWSLAVEEQFYLLWPMLLVFFTGRGWRAVVTFLITASALVLLWRSALLFRTGNVAYVYNAFDTRFDCLAIGCLLALCVEKEGFRRFVGVVSRWSWLPLVTLGILALLKQGPPAYQYSLGFTVHALLLSVFIIQLVTLHRSRLWSWLDHPMVRYVGALSYPMYLYHQWGLGLAVKVSFLPGVGQYAFGMAATIAAAAASYHFIERPFLRLKKRFEPRGIGASRPLPEEPLDADNVVERPVTA
jgi:peptidoglycan/LPS O-acetylase OafA/YrhL